MIRLLLLTFCISLLSTVTFCFPISGSTVNEILAGEGTCTGSEELIHSDPCKPLCTCRNGLLICAELTCATDSVLEASNCRKVPANGKCCPSYICMMDNGTAEMHYPLPQLYLPKELDLSKPHS